MVNVVYRNPVHAGGLHPHRLDPALLQPFRQPVQILREALKHPYRLGSPIRSHRRVMFPASDVDSRRVAMDHIQTRTAGPDLPPQFLPLLACEPLILVRFRCCFACHDLSHPCGEVRGTARSRFGKHSLQRGQATPCEAAATTLMIDRTGARLWYGKERAIGMPAIACRASLPP